MQLPYIASKQWPRQIYQGEDHNVKVKVQKVKMTHSAHVPCQVDMLWLYEAAAIYSFWVMEVPLAWHNTHNLSMYLAYISVLSCVSSQYSTK